MTSRGLHDSLGVLPLDVSLRTKRQKFNEWINTGKIERLNTFLDKAALLLLGASS